MKKILIGQVSRDPFVLVKIIHTLRPQYILLFLTEVAQREGWFDKIKNVLNHYKKTKFILHYEYSILENLLDIRNTVTQFIDSFKDTISVYTDTTTGLGIYRVLIFEFSKAYF